jgi:hypothetical protein
MTAFFPAPPYIAGPPATQPRPADRRLRSQPLTQPAPRGFNTLMPDAPAKPTAAARAALREAKRETAEAAALRANLHRRKQQARARETLPPEDQPKCR